MAGTAKKSDPKLWQKVKEEATKSDKGGKPGQWSARKAQMATAEYKERGGEYEGRKSKDNHLQQWTDEEWDTRSGSKSGETGERYLPKKARETLSEDEYDRSSAKKRSDSAKGRQHSRQPKDVAEKAASARHGSETKADLMKRARAESIPGRSSMTKAELQHALSA